MGRIQHTAVFLATLSFGVTFGCLFDEGKTAGLYCLEDAHCGDNQACCNEVCVVGDCSNACIANDDPCDSYEDCCDYDGSANAGSADCIWFTNDPDTRWCTNICADGGDCDSGCCVPSATPGISHCLDASFCEGSCSQAFEPCETTADCCNYNGNIEAGSADCIWWESAPDDKFCADLCTNHEQCSTGCCVEIGETGLGACLDASFCS